MLKSTLTHLQLSPIYAYLYKSSTKFSYLHKTAALFTMSILHFATDCSHVQAGPTGPTPNLYVFTETCNLSVSIEFSSSLQ